MTTDALVRIHVVAEETGVPEPTLRAWERRYGIPSPERTSAGYRLYGRREIEQVREMRALCDAGVAAAEAAQRVRRSRRKPGADPLAAARQSILEAVVAFDVEAMETRIRQAFFLGDPLTIVEGLIEPALVEIGARWQRGELTVAQEHFASHRIGLLLLDLLRLVPLQPDAERVLLACFADDDHELGLYALAVRLTTWGFRPVVVGARTPPDALRSAIVAVDAVVVGLSSTVPPPRSRAKALIGEYGAACGATPWVVGGAGVAELESTILAAGGLVAPRDTARLRAMFESLRRKKS